MSLTHRPPRLPAHRSEMPAPHLTKDGRCSDCSVQAVLAGGDELKVCPQCYALLWHVEWSVEERRQRHLRLR
jgi:hypothetical protein